MSEVDQVPAGEVPVADAFRFVLEADKQVHGIVALECARRHFSKGKPTVIPELFL